MLIILRCCIIFFVLQFLYQACYATINNSCIPSFCGHIDRIAYPFRLKTDPSNCGLEQFQLTCEGNIPFVHISNTKFYVKEINYNNFTIRFSQLSLLTNDYCSLPKQSSITSFSSLYPRVYDPYPILGWNYEYLYQSLVFITCPKPIASPLYVDTYPCYITYNATLSSSISNSYVKVGPNYAKDLEDSCTINRIYLTSLFRGDVYNASYADIRQSLDYGFKLSFFHEACCAYYPENYCNLDAATFVNYCGQSSRSSIIQYTYLRSLLIKLEKTALGRILIRFNWNPSLYFDLDLQGYIFALLRYALVLFVLYRSPFFLGACVCGIIFFINKWRRRHLSEYGTVEDFLQTHNNLMPVRYSYSDIKKITKGFRDKLGEGGFGSVYKGKLRSGYFSAVKMLAKSKSDGRDFMNEVATIGRIHHVNVVSLVGFCAEGSKRALIYDFMPNGSLDKYIFSDEVDTNTIISIKKMYEISLGIAHGIEYLHRGCNMQILHFDIKPHNILLDENFVPKVSDFGLAKLYPTDNSIVSLTAARGTMGYMAPELVFKNIGNVSYKADVYSFGKLLVEMAVRRKKADEVEVEEHMSQLYFPSWVYEQINQGKDIELRNITTEEERKITKKMILVALWCVQLKPSDRPSMHKVVEMLESENETVEMPPKPSFIPKQDFEIKGSEGLTNIPKSYLDSISWMVNGR